MEFMGKEVPVEIQDALAARVALLENKAVAIYARELKVSGMRITPQNAPRLRGILETKILKAVKVSAALQNFIENLVITTGCFGVLSSNAINNFADDWMGYFGEADVLGCWLFDTRDSVRQLAMRKLSGFPNKKVPSRAKALGELQDNFHGFLSQIEPLVRGVDKPSSAAPQQDAAQIPDGAMWGDELQELRKAANKSSKLQKLLDEARAKVDAGRKHGDELQADKNELLQIIRGLEKRNSTLDESLRREYGWRANSVKDGVERELTARENRWLADLEELQKQGAGKFDEKELFAMAEGVLERQQKIDSIYGNRRRLEEQLARLDDLHRSVQTARLESLKPLNELNQIEELIEKEKDAITAQLGGDSSVRVPRQFIDEVDAAETLDELNRCREKLQSAVKVGFVEKDVQLAFEKLFHRRQSLIYLKALAPRVVTAAPLKGFKRLVSEIRNGEPLKIWVDGHNVINTLDVFREISRSGKDHQAVRGELIRRLVPLARAGESAQWVLVFDSKYASNEPTSQKNLVVRYSGGGQRSQRADNVISAEISFEFSESSALSRYVFTNDNTLAAEVEAMGVCALSCDDLEDLFELRL
jgi:predicted RNA-binding protein with PIN domain